jgi:hypothetical protein
VVPLGVVALAAIVALGLRLRPHRRYQRVPLPSSTVGYARCDGCGARLPVRLREAVRCPFCEADLLPDAALDGREDEAAWAHVECAARRLRQEQVVYDHHIQRTSARTLQFVSGYLGIFFGAGFGMPRPAVADAASAPARTAQNS